MGEEVKAIVPESVLKKQKREEEWTLAKKQELEAAKKKRAENRKLIYKRAKQYAKEYEEQVYVTSPRKFDLLAILIYGKQWHLFLFTLTSLLSSFLRKKN